MPREMIWIEKELPRASLLGMWMGVRTTLIWSEPNFYTPEPVRTFNPTASVTWPSGRLRNVFRNGQVNRAHPGAVGIADYNAERYALQKPPRKMPAMLDCGSA